LLHCISWETTRGERRGFEGGLAKLEFLVVQDIFMTETAKLAHVVLPAASSSEKSGTFTNVERRLQQLNKAEEPFGESRPTGRSSRT